MRPFFRLVIAIGGASALSACADDAATKLGDQTRDPIIARALHDPLMVDPDLAYRNEAAAALTYGAGQPLPVLAGNAELARLARDDARLELLEDGAIAELPEPSDAKSAPELSASTSARDLVMAFDGPSECTQHLKADFGWATRLDRSVPILPRGYVRAAAGVESDTCSIRVVRYLTPATVDTAMEYHFNWAVRSGLKPAIYESPQSMVIAKSDGSSQVTIIRESPNAMRQVDLVSWRKK